MRPGTVREGSPRTAKPVPEPEPVPVRYRPALHNLLSNGVADAPACPIYRCRLPPGTRSVSGQIQFVSGDWGEYGLPRAAISLNGTVPPGTPHCACTGLMAFLRSDNNVQYEMHGNGNVVPFAQANLGVPITFKVSIDPSGQLTVSIDKTDPVTKTLKLDYPVNRPLRLSCSGADVVFSDLHTE